MRRKSFKYLISIKHGMKKLYYLNLAFGALMSLCLTSCSYFDDDPVDPEEPEVIKPIIKKENIVEKSYFSNFIDNSIYAGDNFYLHAINKWIAANPIPKGYNSISVLGGQSDNSRAALEKIAAGEVGNNPVMNQLIASYNNIDFESDKKMLNSILANIEAVTTKEGVYKAMAQMMKNGYVAPCIFSIVNFEREAQTGLFSPLSVFDMNITVRNVTDFTELSNDEAAAVVEAGENWKKFMITSKFATAKKDVNRHRLPQLVKMSVNKTRGAQTTVYQELGLGSNYVAEEATREMLNTFEKYDIETQKALLKYFVLQRDLDLIATKKEDVTSIIHNLITKKYCIMNTLVSRIYNETQITPETVQLCKTLCEEHRAVFRERIQNLKWMSNATKQKAIEKLDEMQFYVAWPDTKHPEWEVQPVTATTGYQAALKIFEQSYTVFSKLNGQKSTDALFFSSWFTSPAYEDNAFYYPNNNNMNILSSNLVPPVYDPSLGEAYLYASLGSTIGHEMTHGFDSNGSKHNKYGKMENWWANDDKETFLTLQGKLIEHFDSLSYYPNYKCDGEQTLAENIADLGGLNISYQTYMKHLEKNGATQEMRDYQAREFFRAYAYTWAENINEKAAEAYKTDEHAAACLRVNGNVFHMDEFYRVFNIQTGDMGIFPADERTTIW